MGCGAGSRRVMGCGMGQGRRRVDVGCGAG